MCAGAGPHESWRSTLFRLGPAVQRLSLQALSESSTRASYVSVHTLSWRPTPAHTGEWTAQVVAQMECGTALSEHAGHGKRKRSWPSSATAGSAADLPEATQMEPG